MVAPAGKVRVPLPMLSMLTGIPPEVRLKSVASAGTVPPVMLNVTAIAASGAGVAPMVMSMLSSSLSPSVTLPEVGETLISGAGKMSTLTLGVPLYPSPAAMVKVNVSRASVSGSACAVKVSSTERSPDGIDIMPVMVMSGMTVITTGSPTESAKA